MNTDIEKLIDKYYKGETSLDEEKLLRDTLPSEEIKDEHTYDQLLFKTFQEEKEEQAPSSTKVFFQTINKPHKFIFSHKRMLYLTSGITACLIFVIGIIFYQLEQKNAAYVMINGVRINDKKLAVELVNENLYRVSTMIDRGLEPLNKAERMEKKLDSILKISNESFQK